MCQPSLPFGEHSNSFPPLHLLLLCLRCSSHGVLSLSALRAASSVRQLENLLSSSLGPHTLPCFNISHFSLCLCLLSVVPTTMYIVSSLKARILVFVHSYMPSTQNGGQYMLDTQELFVEGLRN